MHRKNKIITMGLLIAMTTLFQGCTNGWYTFHEGSVEGKKYIVQTRAVSSLFGSSSRIEYRLRYGKLPYLPIDPQTTDWNIVYNTAIFGQDHFEYITTKDVQYSNDIDEAVGARTFLYLLPNDVNKQEYIEYLRFFKSPEWQKSDSICIGETQDSSPFPHIVGLVYGDPSNYIQDFRGTYLDQEYILRIENDGRIRMVDSAEIGEVGTGLSPKVQMPGQIIYLPSPSSGAITIDDLKGFKNKQSQSPLEVFNFAKR